MLPLVDKPVVQYVIEELAAAGIERVLFVTGRRKRAIEDHFDADPELERAGAGALTLGGEMQVLYTRQPHPAGLGDALRYGEGFAGGRPVVVALGDAIIEPCPLGTRPIVARLIDAYERLGASAAVAVAEVPDELVSRYGVVIPRERRPTGEGAAALAGAAALDVAGAIEVADVIEKPPATSVTSRLAVMGRYVLGPAVFEALRRTRPDATGEVQLADALRTVLAGGGRVVAVTLAGGEHRHDIGTVQSYCEAFLAHALSHPRYGPGLRARAASLLDGRR
jgi:UTP--glucose-1-phosphate uridylyltransferase